MKSNWEAMVEKIQEVRRQPRNTKLFIERSRIASTKRDWGEIMENLEKGHFDNLNQLSY